MDRTTHTTYYLATFEGRGEFYTGIRHGDTVLVSQTIAAYDGYDGRRKASAWLSAQAWPGTSAWLSINSVAELSDIEPIELSDEEIAWRHGRGPRPVRPSRIVTQFGVAERSAM